MKIRFTKLHGLGNDFVFIDDFDCVIELSAEQVAHICDRHFGIGADGVILVRPSQRDSCVAYMHYINSDGTLAEMCGNGIRCFAKFLVDNGYVDPSAGFCTVDTLRGPLSLSFEVDEENHLRIATVDMDKPILDPSLIPVTLEANAVSAEGAPFVREAPLRSPWGVFEFTCVSMGNPHAVCFLDDMTALPDEVFTTSEKSLASFDLNRIGAYFEAHEVFPAKSNIEFAEVTPEGLSMRVFERGCAETLACGTGTCATLVAAVLTQRSPAEADVELLGGTLHICWNDDGHVMMTGPATESFSGVIEIN